MARELLTRLSNGDLFLERPDCGLACNFCLHGIRKGRTWPAAGRHLERLERLAMATFGGRLRSRLRAEFRRYLTSLEPGPDSVCLAGWDVLESPWIFDLLDIASKTGHRVRIVTPGLRLADPAFATRISKYTPEITVSYLTCDPVKYARMVGLEEAKAIVDAAIRNLKANQIAFSVNFVATRDNFGDLQDVSQEIIDRVGCFQLVLKCYFPDPDYEDLPFGRWNRFVDYGLVDRELVAFVANRTDPATQLVLSQLPPCKLSFSVLSSPAISCEPFEGGLSHPGRHVYRSPSCSKCAWSGRCAFVPLRYRVQHPTESFDFEKVNRWLAGWLMPNNPEFNALRLRQKPNVR